MEERNSSEIFDLSLFKMGYVIQYRMGKDFFSRMIYKEQLKRGFSKESASWTHCEISGGEEMAIYAKPPKSEFIDITKAHRGQEFRLMRPRIYDTDNRDALRYKVAYFSASMNHEPYDNLGVLRFKIPFLFSVTKAKFCSEHCVLAIRKAFPYFYEGTREYDFMPAHFGSDREMQLIMQGRLP